MLQFHPEISPSSVKWKLRELECQDVNSKILVVISTSSPSITKPKYVLFEINPTKYIKHSTSPSFLQEKLYIYIYSSILFFTSTGHLFFLVAETGKYRMNSQSLQHILLSIYLLYPVDNDRDDKLLMNYDFRMVLISSAVLL